MCHVTGFLPYFYIPAPVGFRREQLKPFQLALEVLPPSTIHCCFCAVTNVETESGESRTTGYPSR